MFVAVEWAEVIMPVLENPAEQARFFYNVLSQDQVDTDPDMDERVTRSKEYIRNTIST